MPTESEDTGFISRWSRRKVLVRQGATVVPAIEPVAAVQSVAVAPRVDTLPVVVPAGPACAQPVSDPAAELPPPPTLADVAALTRDSDYTRFVGSNVQPEVKNAALAKLFTDPHFNVMDRLDVYIDDYGTPDPLPPGMLRKMLQAHVLGLFDDEDDDAKKTALANATPPDCVAVPPTESSAHEDTDLQLQPDDDAGCAGPEPGAGQDAGGPHGRPGDGPHPAVPA